jgi:hypothetical protein
VAHTRPIVVWGLPNRADGKGFVAVEAVGSIFRLVFVILEPTKMSTSGDESGAELPEPSLPIGNST